MSLADDSNEEEIKYSDYDKETSKNSQIISYLSNVIGDDKIDSLFVQTVRGRWVAATPIFQVT